MAKESREYIVREKTVRVDFCRGNHLAPADQAMYNIFVYEDGVLITKLFDQTAEQLHGELTKLFDQFAEQLHGELATWRKRAKEK